MGQYYNPVVKDGNKWRRISFSNEEYGFVGWKLMEHSYCRNPLILNVEKYLLNNPLPLVWCGDYSNASQYDEEYRNNFTEKYHLVEDDIYKAAWDSIYNIPLSEVMSDEEEEKFLTGLYLINDTKKSYIPLKEYEEAVLDTYGYSVSPLSLLTAAGNGQGGGDYHETYPNYDMVGYWMGDTIRTSYELPEGYTNCLTNDYIFVEGKLVKEPEGWNFEI